MLRMVRSKTVGGRRRDEEEIDAGSSGVSTPMSGTQQKHSAGSMHNRRNRVIVRY